MRRSLVAIPLLLIAGACMPADEQYCRSFGVAGTPEYCKCISYFNQQSQAFETDRNVCEVRADGTYPPTLYDRGGFAPVSGGFWAGRYSPGGMIQVQPDYYHNGEVDRLRMRIIEPCMDSLGWNSATSWQAGRHATVQQKLKAPNASGNLPWLRK